MEKYRILETFGEKARALREQIWAKPPCRAIATELEAFELKMHSNGEAYTSLTLKDEKWVFDRSKSGEAIVGVEKDEDSLNGIRRMPFSGNKEATITIVMDEFSVEIFEDGRALSSTVYPPEDANGLELAVKATSCQYERADINLK